jgi:hypothetical protein
MLGKHAENRGGGYHTEPAIEEMCGYMKRGAFMIASHMSELGEEILSYHRDEDYKIVRLRDDLISAVRYAFMMRHQGKPLDGCERATGERQASTGLSTIRGPRDLLAGMRRNMHAARLIIPTARSMCSAAAEQSGADQRLRL